MSSETKTIIIDTGNIFKFGIIQRKGLNDVNVEVKESLVYGKGFYFLIHLYHFIGSRRYRKCIGFIFKPYGKMGYN